MHGIRVVELLIECIILLLVVGGIIAFFFGGLSQLGRLRMPRFGHATLTCPHCQQETRINAPQCQSCTRDLRG